ncbi:uncharacterized protein LOC114580855 [Dendrobium catenatum]|uniref:uncharacterized protein LOC114580855 n=1 Tax=Dendrobium catenatum TaxID=906689 RepID=UPI00109FDD8B|nr:uncharacterized protein LOC114580855 [Dendrobium catenatum]
MDVGQVILGHPWLFDKDVHICDRSNICVFEYGGKKIKFFRSQPKSKDERKSNSVKPSKGLDLVSANIIDSCVAQGAPLYTLVVCEVTKEPHRTIPQKVQPILLDFSDIFPEDLPNQLPPLRDIQHAIDLAQGVSLPNLPYYRINPIEYAKLKRQVDKLLQ